MQDHDRKDHPVATGLVDYFPDALLAIAAVSMEGARKHDTFGPDGRPTWDRSKSTDDADALMRHFIDRGSFDADGHLHSAKVAWRALAVLQRELDADHADESAVDKAVEVAIDEWDKLNAKLAGYDLGKPGGDKGVYFVMDKNGVVVATSDKPMSLTDILKAATESSATGKWAAKAPIPQAPAGDASYQVPAGQKLSLGEMAKLLIESGYEVSLAPKPQPDSLLKQHEGLTEVEQFATWLTTRQACVHVGAKHAVYEMFEAVEEWYRDHPRK